MTIVDEQHAVADDFTADGHAGARIEETIWEALQMKGFDEDIHVSIR